MNKQEIGRRGLFGLGAIAATYVIEKVAEEFERQQDEINKAALDLHPNVPLKTTTTECRPTIGQNPKCIEQETYSPEIGVTRKAFLEERTGETIALTIGGIASGIVLAFSIAEVVSEVPPKDPSLVEI